MMKHLLLTSIFLLMATIAAAANAVTGSVQGHVTDGDTGNAVAGATDSKRTVPRKKDFVIFMRCMFFLGRVSGQIRVIETNVGI